MIFRQFRVTDFNALAQYCLRFPHFAGLIQDEALDDHAVAKLTYGGPEAVRVNTECLLDLALGFVGWSLLTR